MNIFHLDTDPQRAAQMHGDKHVVKMVLETAQMLCTAHRLTDGNAYADACRLYQKAYMNHPMTVWVRTSKENYVWTHHLFYHLHEEFKLRRGKTHASIRLLLPLAQVPFGIATDLFTPVPQCMPDEYKNDDLIVAYRDYYKYKESLGIVHYRWGRPRPDWM